MRGVGWVGGMPSLHPPCSLLFSIFRSPFPASPLWQLIGLAIYNSVLLDLHFPLIVYQKLVGIVPKLR